jgi:hypothetical protein
MVANVSREEGSHIQEGLKSLHADGNQNFFFPAMISRTRTPKLNTSDFIEKRPSEAYSGAI